MNLATTGRTWAIDEAFGKLVPMVRRVLAQAGLGVAAELDVSGESYFRPGIGRRSCVVLLVDTPVLLFEAIALDRGGAVFVPVHLVISGDGETSYVHWANPVTSSGLRPPAPAKAPLEHLCAQVARALAELPQSAEVALQSQSHQWISRLKLPG
jgi:hypothetical protein